MPGKALAKVAKLIGNPTCAQVLDALLSDRRLTVSALAGEIETARSTVSEAVGALAAAGLVHRETHGRTTVVRLAGDEVAEALESLEALGRLARPLPAVGLRAISRMEKLQRGRTCYDHFAGELGVTLTDCLLSAGVLSVGADRETQADPCEGRDEPWTRSGDATISPRASNFRGEPFESHGDGDGAFRQGAVIVWP